VTEPVEGSGLDARCLAGPLDALDDPPALVVGGRHLRRGALGSDQQDDVGERPAHVDAQPDGAVVGVHTCRVGPDPVNGAGRDNRWSCMIYYLSG
jgi:hypothetical protein